MSLKDTFLSNSLVRRMRADNPQSWDKEILDIFNSNSDSLTSFHEVYPEIKRVLMCVDKKTMKPYYTAVIPRDCDIPDNLPSTIGEERIPMKAKHEEKKRRWGASSPL